MAGASARSGKISSVLLSNLPGAVSAIVLAGGVGYICKYNFFLLFVIFLLLYFVIGTAAEFLIVALHIEKVKLDRKKQGNTGRRKTASAAKTGQNKIQTAPAETVPEPVEEENGFTEAGTEEILSEQTDMREALFPNQKARMQYVVSAKVKIMKSDDLQKKTKEEET